MHAYSNRLWQYILTVLQTLGIATFASTLENEQIYNRTRIFLQEAKNRNVTVQAVKMCGRITHEFRFRLDGQWHYFDHIPLAYRPTKHSIDDKAYVRDLLQQSDNIPVPDGQAFTSQTAAFLFGMQLGFPLVVKPRYASLSRHATYPITNESELQKGIRIAFEYQPACIVERFIRGNLYRATVLGGSAVFVCRKEKPHVVGDGERTIKELIAAKNADPKRGPAGDRRFTLHEITINDALKQQLAHQDRTLNSVPAAGERVILHNKYTLAAGCDICECTKHTHPENKELFRRLADCLDANILGIDFICEDIAQPYTQQESGIIETNSRPYIDMHARPSSGEPQPVAETGWDIVLAQIRGDEE